jgi:hypothetical protein
MPASVEKEIRTGDSERPNAHARVDCCRVSVALGWRGR